MWMLFTLEKSTSLSITNLTIQTTAHPDLLLLSSTITLAVLLHMANLFQECHLQVLQEPCTTKPLPLVSIRVHHLQDSMEWVCLLHNLAWFHLHQAWHLPLLAWHHLHQDTVPHLHKDTVLHHPNSSEVPLPNELFEYN